MASDRPTRLTPRDRAIETAYDKSVDAVLLTLYYEEGRNYTELARELTEATGLEFPEGTIPNLMLRWGVAPGQLAREKASERSAAKAAEGVEVA